MPANTASLLQTFMNLFRIFYGKICRIYGGGTYLLLEITGEKIIKIKMAPVIWQPQTFKMDNTVKHFPIFLFYIQLHIAFTNIV